MLCVRSYDRHSAGNKVGLLLEVTVPARLDGSEGPKKERRCTYSRYQASRHTRMSQDQTEIVLSHQRHRE
jgi:hypothetical protein